MEFGYFIHIGHEFFINIGFTFITPILKIKHAPKLVVT